MNPAPINPASGLTSWKDWSEIIKNGLTTLAILVGGTWTLFRFILFRERHAKIEFNLECSLLGIIKDSYLIELAAVVCNKGSVRHYIREWTFDLLFFNEADTIDETNEKINYQVTFPAKKISKRPWVPASWYYTFVDAGTTQRYTYLTSIPANAQYVSLYSRFIYPKTDDFHSCQKTFAVDQLLKVSGTKRGAEMPTITPLSRPTP